MIPTLSYKFYYSNKYLEWLKCVKKAKKAGYNEKNVTIFIQNFY